MTEKEKIEFKKEILEDISDCLSYCFENGGYYFDSNKYNRKLEKYKNILLGMNYNNES